MSKGAQSGRGYRGDQEADANAIYVMRNSKVHAGTVVIARGEYRFSLIKGVQRAVT